MIPYNLTFFFAIAAGQTAVHMRSLIPFSLTRSFVETFRYRELTIFLGISSCPFLSGFTNEMLFQFLISPIPANMPRPSHLPSLDHPNNSWFIVQVTAVYISFRQFPVISSLLDSNILPVRFEETATVKCELHIKLD
jgi:hypothetical protein